MTKTIREIRESFRKKVEELNELIDQLGDFIKKTDETLSFMEATANAKEEMKDEKE